MMSVRYAATWYDVMQAWQQDTHHTHRHVPARPAGLQFSVLLTQYRCDRQLGGTVYAGVIGSKWRSSVLLFASDSDCIPIVGAVLSLKF